jgi:hypothetical protein
MISLVGRLSLTLAPLRKSPIRYRLVWVERRSLLWALFHAQISAAHHFPICRSSCDSRFILCTRLCRSGNSIRCAASRLRLRSRYPAIRITCSRAAIRLTSRHVPLRCSARRASLRPPTSRGAIWSTSGRMTGINVAKLDRQSCVARDANARTPAAKTSARHARRLRLTGLAGLRSWRDQSWCSILTLQKPLIHNM